MEAEDSKTIKLKRHYGHYLYSAILLSFLLCFELEMYAR